MGPTNDADTLRETVLILREQIRGLRAQFSTVQQMVRDADHRLQAIQSPLDPERQTLRIVRLGLGQQRYALIHEMREVLSRYREVLSRYQDAQRRRTTPGRGSSRDTAASPPGAE